METFRQVITYGRDTLWSGIKYVYSDINPSTLTGAIDIIVVEQRDGTFACGPFHVRFGKMGTLKPADKIVDIHLNGKYLENLHMKLGTAGEAYFIESINEKEKEDVDMSLEVSPFQSDVEDGEAFYDDNSEEVLRPVSTDNIHPSRIVKKRLRRANRIKSEGNIVDIVNIDIQDKVLSLTESNVKLEDNIREGYNSDGAVDNPTKVSTIQDMNMKWEWGNFPSRNLAEYKPITTDNIIEIATNATDTASAVDVENPSTTGSAVTNLDSALSGASANMPTTVVAVATAEDTPVPDKEVYLEELMGSSVPEETKAKFLYSSVLDRPGRAGRHRQYYDNGMYQLDAGYKSDEGSPPQAMSPTYPVIHELKLSLCGDFSNAGTKISEEKFFRYLVSYEDFMKEPDEVLKNSSLVVLLNGKYYSWPVAAPALLSIVAFQTELPSSTMNNLKSTYMCTRKPRRSTWFRWGRPQQEEGVGLESANGAAASPAICELDAAGATVVPVVVKSDSMTVSTSSTGLEDKSKVYLKKIRLSSEEIAALDLREGRNDIKFSMTTKYQGTTYCHAAIYRWKWHDKIVISDVDGTITKSDVLGHVLPILGRDWTQVGVAKLYNKIYQNNYKFIYLSARAIGQSGITRNFLQDITQDASEKLPEGPILLSPTSLFQSLHREVIAKKPEVFKIQCLNDVRQLFPEGSQPLYAGFGNRINDVAAYKGVGIDPRRIFTVNPEGSLKNEYCQKWSTSYGNLSEIADHFFQFQYNFSDHRLMTQSRVRLSFSEYYFEDYTDVNYWGAPVNETQIQDELEYVQQQKQSSIVPGSSSQSVAKTTTSLAPSAK